MNLRGTFDHLARLGGLVMVFMLAPAALDLSPRVVLGTGWLLGFAVWVLWAALDVQADRNATAAKQARTPVRQKMYAQCGECRTLVLVEPCGNYWCAHCGKRSSFSMAGNGLSRLDFGTPKDLES